MPTTETTDSASIIIRNVTTTGFEALQVEPASQDGTQGAMTMHYIAVEEGTHELPDGTRVLAGSVSTDATVFGSGVGGSKSTISVAYPQWPGSSAGTGGLAPQLFSYDANGNRTQLTEDAIPYTYTNQTNTNRLLSTTGPAAKTYSYDAAGNAIGDGVHTYTYDDRGRLVTVDGTAATYVHNGLGQRVNKDNGTVTLFAYDEQGNLIGEYDSTGNAVSEHIWFAGAPVANLQGADTFYVHTDHLGTPRVLSNGNTVVWRWESDPFGSTLADSDPDGDATVTTYNLRFPGQYYDSETGLHYNYFRTYDPSTGRYLESDPIGLWGGLNTYGYAAGNPLLYIDPYGLDFFDPVFGAVYWATDGWSPSQSTVDAAAGFGDGLSGGITSWVRDQAGIDGGVDKCSAAYRRSRTTGNATSLTLGGGRLVYAGLAKGYSITASSGRAASAGRSSFRRYFGGGGSLRPPDLSRYPTDAALRAAAGRTNPYANAAGAAAAGLGANDLANGDECECSQ